MMVALIIPSGTNRMHPNDSTSSHVSFENEEPLIDIARK